MNKRLIFILLATLLVACKSSYDYYISAEQMEDILYDMHRTEGILQAKGGGLINTTEGRAYYANTLDKHGITPAEFDSALVWYTAHPETFIRVYGHVVQRLEKEKMRLKKAADLYPHLSMTWSNPLVKYGYQPRRLPLEIEGYYDDVQTPASTKMAPLDKTE